VLRLTKVDDGEPTGPGLKLNTSAMSLVRKEINPSIRP